MVKYNAAAAYLPHDEPMVMVDKVIYVKEESACCQVVVSQQGILAPFLTPSGDLPAWFGLEIIAQTIGVWSGFHGRQLNDRKPSPGMLLGGRGYRCTMPNFPAGARLEITVNLLMRDEKIGSFDGEIAVDGACCASGRLNTYQPDADELQQLLQQGNSE